MTSVRMDRLDIHMADVGAPNPMASLDPPPELSARLGPGVPESIVQHLDYGRASSMVPYRMRDGYRRERAEVSLPVAVVENDRLRATFLTTLGGRLWSIYDKRAGQELVYQSPVIQPANLGLTNAWFAGGVEWNISTIGHSPFCFEPLHVVRVDGPHGIPILRMYEFERLRETPFQIDAYLPDDSPYLFVHIRIRNPNASSVPMYWWSNIAVAEGPDVRVIAPATEAFRLMHDGSLTLARVPMPGNEGRDTSYPATSAASTSYYFDVPQGQRPWIASLDRDGTGVAHMSTDRLQGRKMFNWGSSSGGQRWQSFLSEPGERYLEIQAGLTQTQLEHLPMEAHGSWSWVEAFGRVAVPPTVAHGSWEGVVAAVDETIDAAVSDTKLESIEARLLECVDSPPVETFQVGSGWGALEERRRRLASEPTIATPGTPFPASSIGADQAPWVDLLETGVLTPAVSTEPPPGDAGAGWEALLNASPASWLSKLQLGVICLSRGDRRRARDAWEDSLQRSESPWALRYLATLDRLEGHYEGAIQRLDRAVALAPHVRSITFESIEALIAAGRAKQALARIEALAAPWRAEGRVALLEIRASMADADFDRAATIFATDFVVADLREGDLSLEKLWYELQAQLLAREQGAVVGAALREQVRRERPIPPHYDFSMAGS